MGIEQVELATSNAVELLFSFLEHKQFMYRFMTMNDVSMTPLRDVVEKYKHNLIELTPGNNMIEFCKLTNSNVSRYDNHPSALGHELIASQVWENIKTELQI
jgi:hypothetical protein